MGKINALCDAEPLAPHRADFYGKNHTRKQKRRDPKTPPHCTSSIHLFVNRLSFEHTYPFSPPCWKPL